jgi:hypothetical protein
MSTSHLHVTNAHFGMLAEQVHCLHDTSEFLKETVRTAVKVTPLQLCEQHPQTVFSTIELLKCNNLFHHDQKHTDSIDRIARGYVFTHYHQLAETMRRPKDKRVYDTSR